MQGGDPPEEKASTTHAEEPAAARPAEGPPPAAEGLPPAAAARRPLPAITRDNRFFWEGIDRGKLLIQCCSSCGKLRHPPGPMCPACRSFEWHSVASSGRGTVYSFAVVHHPPLPPFAYPNLVVLVELEEGTRIVSNLLEVAPGEVRVGMAVQAEFATIEDGRRLLQFRRAGDR